MLRFTSHVIYVLLFICILIKVSPVKAFDVFEQLQCEGDTWISQCPSYSGHVFLQGFLGRRDPKPCRPYSQGDVPSCEVKGFLRRLQSACFAQELCRFPVARSDSCPASASAYMKATYACVPVKLMWTMCATPSIIREQEGFLVATALSLPKEDSGPCVVRIQAYKNQMVLIDVLQSFDNIKITHCTHSLQIGQPKKHRRVDRSCHAAASRARFSWYVDVVIFHQMAEAANSNIPPDKDFVKILLYFKVVAAKYDYDSDGGDKTNTNLPKRPADPTLMPLPSKPIQNNTFDILNPSNTGLFDTSNPAVAYPTTVIYDVIKPVNGIFSMDTTPDQDESNKSPNSQENNIQYQPNTNNASYSNGNIQNKPTNTEYVPSQVTTPLQITSTTTQTSSTPIKTPKPQMTEQNENKDYSQNLSINSPKLTTRLTTITTTTSRPMTRTTQTTTKTTRKRTTTTTTSTQQPTTATTTTRKPRHFVTFFPPVARTTSTTMQTLTVSVFKTPQYPLPVIEREREATRAPSGVLWTDKSNDQNGASIDIQQRPLLTTPRTLQNQSNQDIVSNRYMMLGVVAGSIVLAIFIVLVILVIVWKKRYKTQRQTQVVTRYHHTLF